MMAYELRWLGAFAYDFVVPFGRPRQSHLWRRCYHNRGSIRFSLSVRYFARTSLWLPRYKSAMRAGTSDVCRRNTGKYTAANKCTTSYVRHRLPPVPRSTKIFTIQQRTRLAIAIILYYIIHASSELDNFALFVFFIFFFFILPERCDSFSAYEEIRFRWTGAIYIFLLLCFFHASRTRQIPSKIKNSSRFKCWIYFYQL